MLTVQARSSRIGQADQQKAGFSGAIRAPSACRLMPASTSLRRLTLLGLYLTAMAAHGAELQRAISSDSLPAVLASTVEAAPDSVVKVVPAAAIAPLAQTAIEAPREQIDRVEAGAESLAAWAYRFSDDENQLLEKIQKGCFQFFWNEVGSPVPLAKDRTSTSICSIASVGFQLSALPIGVERGWITREQGAERATAVLRGLVERDDNKKHGIYLHFIDRNTGGPPDLSADPGSYEFMASTVDHALLQAGAMTAGVYFGGAVLELADRMVAEANWKAFRYGSEQFLSMGWRADTPDGVHGDGILWPYTWTKASDEERLIYFLAVGAPGDQHGVPAADYYRLRRTLRSHGEMPPFVASWSGSLFTYFFSHCWINYRGMAADDPAAHGVDAPPVDWFENSRRAALTHRQRAVELSSQFPTLGENRWGLSPCVFRTKYVVQEFGPNLSNNDHLHEGAVAPYGAGSSIMFAPEMSVAALREYVSLTCLEGKPLAWRDPELGGYGLVDSFHLDPPHADEEYLGIDQGPMLLAIENARSGLVWRLFMEHPSAQEAARRLKLAPR